MQFKPSNKALAVITSFAMASALTIAVGTQSASAVRQYTGKKVTIELRGPNQWNNNATCIGTEWER